MVLCSKGGVSPFCVRWVLEFVKAIYAFSGPTGGDFDQSLRQFSKSHTLGSFGRSFTGTGDHEGVMNKVYDRLQHNNAGHYNKEQQQQPPRYDADTEFRQKPNSENNNYDNYRNSYNRGERQTENPNVESRYQRQRRSSSRGNQDQETAYSDRGGDPFASIELSGGSRSHNSHEYPRNLYEFENPFEKQKKKYDPYQNEDPPQYMESYPTKQTDRQNLRYQQQQQGDHEGNTGYQPETYSRQHNFPNEGYNRNQQNQINQGQYSNGGRFPSGRQYQTQQQYPSQRTQNNNGYTSYSGNAQALKTQMTNLTPTAFFFQQVN